MMSNQDNHDAETRVLFEPLVSDLFVSWQNVREAIGRVETSQPAKMTDAMNDLLVARSEMELVIRAFMKYVISR